jgi:hypothetical protein
VRSRVVNENLSGSRYGGHTFARCTECRVPTSHSKFDLRTSPFALHKLGWGLNGIPKSA